MTNAPHMRYPLETQIAELKRELAMRAKVYPRFIEGKKITREQAAERVDIMRCTLELLEHMSGDAHAAGLAAEGKL